MKNNRLLSILIFGLLSTLTSLSAHATDISHVFASGCNFTNDNKTCTTSDGYTYSCGANATFGAISSTTYLKLYNANDYVTLSPAIDNLVELQIYHNTISGGATSVRVYISDDGSTWGEPLPESRMTYRNSYVLVKIPKGRHFVKILQTSGTPDVNISQITHTTTDCNCFEYIPE